MTDRQKLLTSLLSEHDPDTGIGTTVLALAAMLESVRDEQSEAILVSR